MGWSYEAWVRWAWDRYGLNKPVVQWLVDHLPVPPGPGSEVPVAKVAGLLTGAGGDLEAALALLQR